MKKVYDNPNRCSQILYNTVTSNKWCKIFDYLTAYNVSFYSFSYTVAHFFWNQVLVYLFIYFFAGVKLLQRSFVHIFGLYLAWHVISIVKPPKLILIKVGILQMRSYYF